MKQNILKKWRKYFFLVLYKCVARHLPHSNFHIIGKFCMKFRSFCCRQFFLKCGKNVNIEHGASFGKGFNIEIGDYSGIGIHCTVPNNIIIGKDVMMGPHCYILDRNHDISQKDIPMRKGGFMLKNTIIEDDVWIGRQVIFTPGRIVRKGTVIAAGTVLCKDFPKYSIVGGNPSQLIRARFER